MVSIPCCVYDVHADKYVAVSCALRDLVGIDLNDSFRKFLERVHPIDRLRILTNYASEMGNLLSYVKGVELPRIQNVHFRVQNGFGQWLKCEMKMDILTYNDHDVPDKVFAILEIHEFPGEDADRPILSTELHGPRLTRKFNQVKMKLLATERKRHAKKVALTSREREIVTLIAEGFCTKEIAGRLGISFHTVETHRKNLFVKFEVHNAAGLLHSLMAGGIWRHP